MTTTAGGLPAALSLGRGEADVTMNFAAPLVIALDEGVPIVLLAGVHSGCFELFGSDRVRTIGDLKGKTAAVSRTCARRSTCSSRALRRRWGWIRRATSSGRRIRQPKRRQLLAEGKIDAFLGFPPDPQELRARKVGHVVLNSAVDRPWSQYFCCMVSATANSHRKHPVATKRAVRAILKASEICASDPDGEPKRSSNKASQ
jgi:NitT/TauT family transport system substrate-binding protein